MSRKTCVCVFSSSNLILSAYLCRPIERDRERVCVCAQACIKHTYKSCKYMHMHTHTHPLIHAHVTQIDVASTHGARARTHTRTHTHTHTCIECATKKKAKQRGGTYARRKPRVWDEHAYLRGTSKSCASRGRGARPRKRPFQGRRGGLTVLSSQVCSRVLKCHAQRCVA